MRVFYNGHEYDLLSRDDAPWCRLRTLSAAPIVKYVPCSEINDRHKR